MPQIFKRSSSQVKINSLKENLWYLLKNTDTDDIAHLLRAYCYCFMASGLPLVVFRGLMGLLIAAVVSILFAFVIFIITNKTSDVLSKTFYSGRKPRWTTREKFQGALDQVMFLNAGNNFRKHW
jgi:hypothetical protein